MLTPFRNEPLRDFSDPGQRDAMHRAVVEVAGRLGESRPLVINGQAVSGVGEIVSTDPADNQTVVAKVAKAGPADVQRALAGAWDAFAAWQTWTPTARAQVLVRAAAIMRRRKAELSAWEIFEAGKTWGEADGDVAEAIDFLEYYARQMIRLGQGVEVTQLPGERDEAFYQALGVGVVIPPWNFPLAIPTGMVAAAVVAGNTVLFKPASTTPMLGALLVEILSAAGLPPGVVQFLPGAGAAIGDLLVSHPKVRFISFTGSKDVGLGIIELAAHHQTGQRWVKRVVAEMGGKDAIVVDETADLMSAADGIVASAFGFQGQKCSACSRAIIVDAVYDKVVEAVVERTQALVMGHPKEPTVQVGPVIDSRAKEKIAGYLALAPIEGTVVVGGQVANRPGNYIHPTVVVDVLPDARLAQEEIFGPVLAVIRATDFDHALEIANGTEYGLTGSLYSQDRSRIARARTEFQVGNLYINRKCTGAMVGAHPFGGFNMSGTDSKTGSPDYLLLFLEMKAVAEKL